MEVRRIKRINSHAGYGRFCEDSGEFIGEIPRSSVTFNGDKIPSPFSCGLTWAISEFDGMRVFVVETDHRRYDVFEIPEGFPVDQLD